jgi:hypothetical protein
MKRTLLLATLAGLVFAMPLAGIAAPDESQKQLIQRAQEARKKLAAAQAAHGPERQKMMHEHMKMMQEMMAQMQKAKPRGGMKPEEMREWIDEHLKLMQQMMSQMMDGHHAMMQGGMDMHGGAAKK